MRQTWKDRRRQLYRGTPTPRVFTMMLMLVVMGLIIVRARDPATWRWFGQDPDADMQTVVGADVADSSSPLKTQPGAPATSAEKTPLAAPKTSAETPPEPTPTGSTDLDRMEWDDMESHIALVEDGSLEMNKLEMPAYFQILSWVDHQPFEVLQKRAHTDVTWNDFRRTPNTMRLQIVELKLNVRQILRCFGPPENGKEKPITTPDGKQLYQLCGFTQESGSNMYYGIVSDLPKGMPIGTFVNVDVKLVGYFFKLQGYYSQQQQLDQERTGKKQTMLKAPVIIGRASWIVSPMAAEEKTPIWGLAAIAGVAIVVVVGWILLAARRPPRRFLQAVAPGTDLDSEEVPGVDGWLDQAQSGRLSLEPVPETTASSDGAALDGGFGTRISGNIFRENDESSNGQGAKNGRGANGWHGDDRHAADDQT